MWQFCVNMALKFSSETAFRLATPSSFRKGEEYFATGSVNKIWKQKGVYKAIVQGARRYNVSISIADEDDIEAICNCPYEGEGICKHIVAAILEFAKSPKLAEVDLPAKDTEKKQVAEDLIKRGSNVQIRKFFKQLLESDNRVAHDFDMFLQGPKETSATVQSYKAMIVRKLDELDLDALEEAWYNSGDDFYDYQPGYRIHVEEYDEQTLTLIAQPFIEEAQKYSDNKNYAESAKIFQAVIEAFLAKEATVTKSHEDVAEWFFADADSALNAYYPVLAATDDPGTKKAGLEYLCRLFEDKRFELGEYQGEVDKGLEQAVKNRSEAEICLHALSNIITKRELSIPESTLLAHLYLLVDDEGKFERISVDHLKDNPWLTLDLLKFYQRHNRRADILKIAGIVLNRFSKRETASEWYSYSADLEIEIRKFLKNIFDPKTEYPQIIENLEKLFLENKKIGDYKELAKTYRSGLEKENFLKRMKKALNRENEIETMFKVFELEGKEEEILELTGKYENAACFPDMIAAILKTYPQESFINYKKKIENLLREANVRIYAVAVYHLKQMRKIGMASDFKIFIDWISGTYSRRRKLIEDMRIGGLI